MKKSLRKSKRTMKRSARSKGASRRRRLRGGKSDPGAPTIGAQLQAAMTATKTGTATASATATKTPTTANTTTIKCSLKPDTGAITIVSQSPQFTATSTSPKSLLIKANSPVSIRNIEFANSKGTLVPAAKIGAGPGIVLQDMTQRKSIVPPSSYLFARGVTATQHRLDAPLSVGSNGIMISNLELGNLGGAGADVPFSVIITM